MNILIDIGHPAHVHLFRFFAEGMRAKGHQVVFTVRNKENEIRLLESFGLQYALVGKHHKSIPGKIMGLILSVAKACKVVKETRPDIFVSHGSIIAAVTSWISRRPHISLEDTGNHEQVRLYLPFTEAVLTSLAFHRDYGRKQVRYNSFHELAYLHPKYFKPDKHFRQKLGVEENEKLIIVRFVSWHATHDKNSTGLSDAEKTDLVRALTAWGRVMISSEQTLSEELERHKYHMPPETIHHALACADLFIGEGATMASECAMLGTPAIYINSQIAGTINEQARNGLIFQFPGFAGTIDKAGEILAMDRSREFFREIRVKMLAGKTDLTALMVWFIENWPESFRQAKADPAFEKEFIVRI